MKSSVLLKSRRSAFAAILLLSSSLTLIATSESANAVGAMQAYANAKYTYCDAKLVAAMWGSGIPATKVRMGQKVMAGQQAQITTKLQASRASGNTCTWADTRYSYEDAQKIAAHWGWDVGPTKAKVAESFTKGNSAIFKNFLGY